MQPWEYFPGVHPEQEEEPAPVYLPAGQQLQEAWPATVEILPAAQFVHAPLPGPLEYFPF